MSVPILVAVGVSQPPRMQRLHPLPKALWKTSERPIISLTLRSSDSEGELHSPNITALNVLFVDVV